MSKAGFAVEAVTEVHQGPVVRCELLSIRTPDGELVDRQVIRHPGAVAVVAVDQGHVLLISQYRAALDADLLELPAGKLDIEGEPPEVAARRELIEEVGLVPLDLVKLGSFYTAAGFCDEQIVVFGATTFRRVERALDGPEELHSTIVRVPVAQVDSLMNDGHLSDSKTLIGLGWARARNLFAADADLP